MRRWLVLVCGLLAVGAEGAWGQTKIYGVRESAIIFRDAGQTPSASAQMTLANLLAGQGRVSAQYDRGSGARAPTLCWRCTFALTGANIPGAALELYVATSDGTRVDGQVATTDSSLAALDTTRVYTMRPLGVFRVNQETTNTPMHGSGCSPEILPDQLISLVIVNRTTLPTQNSASVNRCEIIPTALEVQAAP